MAATHKKPKFCKILLANQADKDPKNYAYNEETPLHIAAAKGFKEVVQVLLEFQVDKNMKNTNDKSTPLHLAVRNGCFDVCKLLLEDNVDKDAKDKNEDTALHLAAKQGLMDICKELIQSGAEKFPRNKNGKSPFDLANHESHQEVAIFLGNLKKRSLMDNTKQKQNKKQKSFG